MENRGFEVELELALRYLLTGLVLDESEYQVINCANQDELADSFKKTYSRLLFKPDDEDKIIIFNRNLTLLEQLRNNQTFIQKDTDGEIIKPLEQHEIQSKTSKDFSKIIEEALAKLIKGMSLTGLEIVSLNAASQIDLIDTFTYVYSKKLAGINEELSDIFELNMFVLKSLKLTSSIQIEKKNINGIDRTQYEAHFKISEKNCKK